MDDNLAMAGSTMDSWMSENQTFVVSKNSPSIDQAMNLNESLRGSLFDTLKFPNESKPVQTSQGNLKNHQMTTTTTDEKPIRTIAEAQRQLHAQSWGQRIFGTPWSNVSNITAGRRVNWADQFRNYEPGAAARKSRFQFGNVSSEMRRRKSGDDDKSSRRVFLKMILIRTPKSGTATPKGRQEEGTLRKRKKMKMKKSGTAAARQRKVVLAKRKSKKTETEKKKPNRRNFLFKVFVGLTVYISLVLQFQLSSPVFQNPFTRRQGSNSFGSKLSPRDQLLFFLPFLGLGSIGLLSKIFLEHSGFLTKNTGSRSSNLMLGQHLDERLLFWRCLSSTAAIA